MRELNMRLSKTPPGLILAGGKSSRMGANKALLPLGDKPVIAHVVERLAPQVSAIAVNAPLPLPGYEDMTLVRDMTEDQLGPLAGILTGMLYHRKQYPEASHFLSAPCDSPFLPENLASSLSAACDTSQTIVIASSFGRRHPVFGLWPVSLAGDLQQWLIADQNRRINAFLDHHHVVTVEFPPLETNTGSLDPFLNINTPEDLEYAQAFAETLS